MLFDEAKLVSERINQDHATTATLLQLAVGGLFDKDANKVFQGAVKAVLKG